MARNPDNENKSREYWLRHMEATKRFRSQKRVVGVGNVDGVSSAALENLRTLLGKGKPTPGALHGGYVYVISDDTGYTKIGLAKSPIGRLSTLQTGNPRRLTLYRAFHFEALSDAVKVEKWAHEIAGRKYAKTLGEWFSCTTSQAHVVIDEASDEVRVAYCVMTPIVDRENTTQRIAA